MAKVRYDRILPPAPTWNWKVFIAMFVAGEALMLYTFLTLGTLQLTPLTAFAYFALGPAFFPLIYYGPVYLWQSHRYLSKVRQELRPSPALDVFISHSSRDEQLARALIEAMEAALAGLRIRCSSVDGYRLEAGADFEKQIREEVLSCKVLLGLITPQSVQSDYVLFELGARWGVGLWTIPLLAVGARVSALPGPVARLNAIDCASKSQIHQLLGTISSVTNVSLCDATKYETYVVRLQTASVRAEV